MDFQDKQFVIGIDLGTTNSAVSYVDLVSLQNEKNNGSGVKNKKNAIKVFNIHQLTGHGEFTKISTLPSFLYIPGEYDISKEVLKHPWKKREDLFAGSFARDHGSKIPSRLVSSAKSWLCNDNADRNSRILPWGSEGVEKVSPVVATSEYLLHIRNAWNYFVKDEDKFLENQFVVITVPASFNEEARELTMKAVNLAGLGNSVTLLEEPLSAFYSWLIHHEDNWREKVSVDDLILVCDVGGGTTDFSLISLKKSDGTPRFERISVGDHLILGGDNIDLAIAHKIESKFKSKKKLSSDKWKTLCHQCRETKEAILNNGQSSVRITIKGEGRSLISGTLAADLSEAELFEILFEQFYPFVSPEEKIQIDHGKKIAEFGLPFEKESAVTKHIISFLEHHRETVNEQLGKDPIPDHILFNGGTLKPGSVQQRIRDAIGKWFCLDKESFPTILENNIHDHAVGVGASYYGLVKLGQGVKVGSGSPRSYYIGAATEDQNEKKAICVVERGLDEGSNIDLSNIKYDVRANEPVSFDIYSSSYRSGDKIGQISPIDNSMTAMSPIQTVIKFGKNGQKKIIPVTIGAEYTELGTLNLSCRSDVSDHRWHLQFQLRDMTEKNRLSETEVYDEELIVKSCKLIRTLFMDTHDSDGKLSSAGKQIEKIVGQKKKNWPLSFIRRLADTLIDIKETKTNSSEHEVRWLNLVGFCIRPGFGDAFDTERIKKLWKIYLEGLDFEKALQNRVEWWIFIRRIAAGLNAGQQRQFFQDISPVLLKGKDIKKISPQEQTELWMALGNMERLLVKDKIILSKTLFPLIKPGKKSDHLLWTLSRLGARELFYGSVDRVVPAKEVTKWINRAVRIPWKPIDPVDNMIAKISRKTGDRTRDLDSESAELVVKWLKDRKASNRYIRMITEKVDVAGKEKNEQFGERLPSGLILK